VRLLRACSQESANSPVAGMTLLAQSYTDDKKRSEAMGVALGGMALGVLSKSPAAASIWFENWGVVSPGLKTGGPWVLKVQQKEARTCSTGFRVSFPEFLIYTNRSISAKCH